jgi:hypothetical protein
MTHSHRPGGAIHGARVCARFDHLRLFLLVLIGTLIGLPAIAQTSPDRDGDGHGDSVDNCLEVANPRQLDTDQDGFGNRCDPDFNNSGAVSGADFTPFVANFNTGEALYDLNGDGVVSGADFTIFIAFFNGPPGPGALQPAFVEEGWIPAPEGPRWVTYTVENGEATHQGDITFPIDELRAWQETVDDPIPLRIQRYDAPASTHFVMSDLEYDGDNGLLTDGAFPDIAGAEALWWQEGWVSWNTDVTIRFELDGSRTIDTVRLTLRNFLGRAFPQSVEISAGGRTHVELLSLDAGDILQQIAISGPMLPDGSRAGLGLEGDVVELTLRVAPGSTVELGEVAFESGTWPPLDPNEPTPDASVNRGGAWGPVVRYSVADGFTTDQLDLIRDALEEWEAKSDYTFVRDPSATPRIRFKPHTSRCYATGVGRPGTLESTFISSVREVRLANGCFGRMGPGGFVIPWHGIVMHEIGHALGFFHEQARKDRDRYVEYFSSNVRSSMRSQYEKEGDKFGEYNYQSIMHYNDTSFARAMCCSDPSVNPAFDSSGGMPDGCGYRHEVGIDTDGDGNGDTCNGLIGQEETIVLKTMVPNMSLPRSFQLGQRVSLSKGDVAAANALLHGDFKARSYNSLSTKAIVGWTREATDHLLGDVDNDGREDLVAIYDETADSGFRGAVYVAHGEPDGTFGDPARWHDSFCSGVTCRLGDLDGDGRKDLVSFDPVSGYVRVAWSYGGRFTTARADLPTVVSTSLARNRDVFVLGDFDGNCTDDIVAIALNMVPNQYYTEYWVQPARIRDGAVTATTSQFYLEMGHYDGQFRLEDVDNDAQADLVHWSSTDDVTVRFATFLDTYGSFSSPQAYGRRCEGVCEMGDMNGDGRADMVDVDARQGHHLERLRILQSTGYALSEATTYHELDCRNTLGCLIGDVDGDGRDDVVDVLDGASALEGSRDRDLGTVWVSLAGEFFSDSIGPVSSGGGSIGSLHQCMDLPGFEL